MEKVAAAARRHYLPSLNPRTLATLERRHTYDLATLKERHLQSAVKYHIFTTQS